jgi:hypothetical protein
MKYEKPPLSFDQQVDQLFRRGMTGERELMKRRLSVVNYYRLSGYSLKRIAPQSQWSKRLRVLLADYPCVPLSDMGFPTKWAESLIWLSDGTEVSS